MHIHIYILTLSRQVLFVESGANFPGVHDEHAAAPLRANSPDLHCYILGMSAHVRGKVSSRDNGLEKHAWDEYFGI